MKALQRAHDRVERHSRLTMVPPRAARPSSDSDEEAQLKTVGQHLSSGSESDEDGRTLFSHLRPPWQERLASHSVQGAHPSPSA